MDRLGSLLAKASAPGLWIPMEDLEKACGTRKEIVGLQAQRLPLQMDAKPQQHTCILK